MVCIQEGGALQAQWYFKLPILKTIYQASLPTLKLIFSK